MNRPRGDLALPRRIFLTASVTGAIVTGGVAGTSQDEDSNVDTAPRRSVLGIEDLVDADAYVRWRVDPDAAPLSSYLDSEVPEFDSQAGTVAGFLATSDADGPSTVESAIFPTGGAERSVIVAADDWVCREYSNPTRTPAEHGTTQWTARTGTTIDTLQIDLLPADRVAVTAASGDERQTIDPNTAVERYAKTVRTRVSDWPKAGVSDD